MNLLNDRHLMVAVITTKRLWRISEAFVSLGAIDDYRRASGRQLHRDHLVRSFVTLVKSHARTRTDE